MKATAGRLPEEGPPLGKLHPALAPNGNISIAAALARCASPTVGVTSSRRRVSAGQDGSRDMRNIMAVTTLFVLAITSSASALSAIGGRNDWSLLSANRLQQLPPQVSSVIRAAQRACGEDEPRVRTGFLRYLKGRNGEEFISLHFDQFHCARSAALCNPAGCMHRVFVSNQWQRAREVWRGQAHDIDLDDVAGRASVTIYCGDTCSSRLHWNGTAFSHQ